MVFRFWFVSLDVGYKPKVASARVWNQGTPENLKVLPPVSEPPFGSPGLVLTPNKHESVKKVALGAERFLLLASPPALCWSLGFGQTPPYTY